MTAIAKALITCAITYYTLRFMPTTGILLLLVAAVFLRRREPWQPSDRR